MTAPHRTIESVFNEIYKIIPNTYDNKENFERDVKILIERDRYTAPEVKSILWVKFSYLMNSYFVHYFNSIVVPQWIVDIQKIFNNV